jgi:hypothetical protein
MNLVRKLTDTRLHVRRFLGAPKLCNSYSTWKRTFEANVDSRDVRHNVPYIRAKKDPFLEGDVCFTPFHQ